MMEPDWDFIISHHIAPGIQRAIEDGMREGLPSAAERRRYALLQAAAHIQDRPKSAVDHVEALLAEIEKREVAQ